ncbi:hypothetical protein E5288_WYG019233 [Bos mutus]|uniref:KRAB domain-containing protein n=1 Tax=Bos mutus TaxID=72004 RepID=A0A6B0RY91_9CETA|nr:hypothetical protein [Bos mutus]
MASSNPSPLSKERTSSDRGKKPILVTSPKVEAQFPSGAQKPSAHEQFHLLSVVAIVHLTPPGGEDSGASREVYMKYDKASIKQQKMNKYRILRSLTLENSFVGYCANRPNAIFKLKQGKEPWILEVQFPRQNNPEDLCNTHDQGARCPESQAENSRQVQEFNFEIRSFLRKGLNRGTGSGTALVNDN